MAGAVAQLGERLVRNEEVRGSTPLGSTSFTLARHARKSSRVAPAERFIYSRSGTVLPTPSKTHRRRDVFVALTAANHGAAGLSSFTPDWNRRIVRTLRLGLVNSVMTRLAMEPRIRSTGRGSLNLCTAENFASRLSEKLTGSCLAVSPCIS
jgi:hypothetical protein